MHMKRYHFNMGFNYFFNLHIFVKSYHSLTKSGKALIKIVNEIKNGA